MQRKSLHYAQPFIIIFIILINAVERFISDNKFNYDSWYAAGSDFNCIGFLFYVQLISIINSESSRPCST